MAAAVAKERWLEANGVRMGRRAGTEVVVNGSRHVANSYGGMPFATFVRIKRIGAGWRFVSADRHGNRPLGGILVKIPLTAAELGAMVFDRRFQRTN